MKKDSENTEYQWSFEPFYSSWNDPRIQQDLDKSEEKVNAFVQKWKDRSDYLESAGALKESLDDYEYVLSDGGIIGNPGEYIELIYESHQDNAEVKSLLNKITDQYNKRSNAIDFYLIRLKQLDSEILSTFADHPLLENYRHFLEILLAESKHVLSEDTQKAVNVLTPTAFTGWVQMTESLLNDSTADVNGETKTLNELLGELANSDQETTKLLGEHINTILDNHKKIAEKELNAVLEYKKQMDGLHGFSRPDSERLLHDDVSEEVVDALVHCVSENFDISQQYYTLKAEKIGKKQLEYYERYLLPSTISKTYDWEASKSITLSVLQELDPEFETIISTMIADKRIDIFPRAGKSGGAFCAYGNKEFPVYILLNHTGSLRDVSTFAHESGHALHHHLYNANQNSINASSSTFTAEVASTFVEGFVFDEILQDSTVSESDRKAISFLQLEDYIASIFRQIALYNFETELHTEYRKKGFLPYQQINELFAKHMSSYLGPSINMGNNADLWWIYWGHIRMMFYVYSYASGLLISKTMGAFVREDLSYVEKVKGFMKAGKSKSGQQIFMEMDIDISKPNFWQKGLDSIRTDLETLKAND